jgi:thiol-disulfide isomerase/thioredoxin
MMSGAPKREVGSRHGDAPDTVRVQLRRRLIVAMAISVVAIVLVILLFAALKPGASSSNGRAAPAIGVGSPAPDFTLPNLLSNPAGPLPPVVLDALGKDRRRPVVLNFFASWCRPCRKETPLLAASAAAEARRGSPVQFIGVAVADNPAQAIPFVTKAGVSYPVGADVDLHVAADVYGLTDEPATFFLHADGVVAARHLGALSAVELRSDLAALTSSRHG